MSREIFYTLMGQTHSISGWARKYGLSKFTLWRRLKKGMSLKDALFKPVDYDPMRIRTPAGELTVKQLAKSAGVKTTTIYMRRRNKWKTSELATPNMKVNRIAAFGQSKTIDEWSVETGVSKRVICQRLRRGWTAEESLGDDRTQKKITAFGKTQTLIQWSKERGVPYERIRQRIKKGLPPEVAIGAGVGERKGENRGNSR
jgi:hypothetical protein